jgi:hypothetical protein
MRCSLCQKRSLPFFALSSRWLASFSVTTLQLRINCLAGPLKNWGNLDDGLAGLEQVVQLFLFVRGPPPRRRP